MVEYEHLNTRRPSNYTQVRAAQPTMLSNIDSYHEYDEATSEVPSSSLAPEYEYTSV